VGRVRTFSTSSRIDGTARIPGKALIWATLALSLGHTHQPGFAQILLHLAERPYVTRIQPAWFE
jgi:hypothetical protein